MERSPEEINGAGDGSGAEPVDESLSHAPTNDRTEVVTAQAVQKEVRDFVRSHEQRRTQFPRAVLVGLLAGLVGTLFRMTLQLVERERTGLVLRLHQHGSWTIVIPMLFGTAGGLLAVLLVQRVSPESSGSGIPHVKAVLLHLRRMRWQRILPVKFVGGVAGIGAGMALGREGPTIQMGAAVGQMVSQWLGVNPRERSTLIAAGAGAGLAAAFNAPLAGMMFVLEEVQRDFTPTVFAASFLASAMADVVTRLITGQNPIFHVHDFPVPPLTLLPAFLGLGALAGILGVVYNRGLLGSLNLFARMRRMPPGLGGALVGALAGAVAWYLPSAAGGGYPLLDVTFAGTLGFAAIAGFFLLRFVLTMFSYGCGAPGGIFAPLLVLGAMMGLFVGEATHVLFPQIPFYPAAFAIVGMGAYFSGIVRAPLTGIVLMLEMSGKYYLILPLLLACLSAYGVADWLGDRPVYEALLERDLLRGQHVPELKETLLLEFSLQPGAPFEGQPIRSLGLPPGCLIVTIHRGIQDIVPTADTALEAGDRITAVVAPQAVSAAHQLHQGVMAHH